MAKATTSAKSGTDQLTSRADAIKSREPQRHAAHLVRGGSFAALGPLRVLLKTIRPDGNLLDCVILAQDGTEGAAIVIARGPELQQSFYHGNTIAGVTYDATAPLTRTASDGSNPDETQKVTPDYLEDASILVAMKFPAGTGVDDAGRPVLWMDMTTPGRQFAVE